MITANSLDMGVNSLDLLVAKVLDSIINQAGRKSSMGENSTSLLLVWHLV